MTVIVTTEGGTVEVYKTDGIPQKLGGPGEYDLPYGTGLMLQAKPNTGYSFSYWTVNSTKYYSNPLSIMVVDSRTITAVFVGTPPPPECTEGSILVLEYCPDGVTWKRRKVCVGGKWQEQSQTCPVAPECTEGAVQILEYCPDGTTWKRRKVCVGGRWQEQTQSCPVETVTMTITIGGQGTVSPYGPGTYTINKGSTITLTATPSPDWTFDSWLGIPGYPINYSNPVTFIANQNLSITAQFYHPTPPPIPQGRLKITNTRTGESIDSDYHDLQNTTMLPNYYFPPMAQPALKVQPNDNIKIEFWIRDKNTQLPMGNVYCQNRSGDAYGAWGTPVPGWPNQTGYNYDGYITWNSTVPSNLESGRRFAIYAFSQL
jgi:hypothetical protein